MLHTLQTETCHRRWDKIWNRFSLSQHITETWYHEGISHGLFEAADDMDIAQMQTQRHYYERICLLLEQRPEEI